MAVRENAQTVPFSSIILDSLKFLKGILSSNLIQEIQKRKTNFSPTLKPLLPGKPLLVCVYFYGYILYNKYIYIIFNNIYLQISIFT